jgi:hypothetical protein
LFVYAFGDQEPFWKRVPGPPKTFAYKCLQNGPALQVAGGAAPYITPLYMPPSIRKVSPVI